jgi:hypothetical protein
MGWDSAHNGANYENGVGNNDCHAATEEFESRVHQQGTDKTSCRVYGAVSRCSRGTHDTQEDMMLRHPLGPMERTYGCDIADDFIDLRCSFLRREKSEIALEALVCYSSTNEGRIFKLSESW